MRPMTAREALALLCTIGNGGTQVEYAQARRILDALVELREAMKVPQLQPMIDAENKLAALERGESPKE